MKRLIALLAVGALTLAACQAPTSTLSRAPQTRAGDIIPGQYIVVFVPSVTDPAALARQKVAAYGGTLLFTYGSALKGFAAELPDTAVAALRADPDVSYIEPNRVTTTAKLISGRAP